MVWELGLQVVFYIDDVLLMAESKDLAHAQTSILTHLHSLGFILNEKKVILEPTLRLEFLSLTVDTVMMEFGLLSDKMKKICAESPPAVKPLGRAGQEPPELRHSPYTVPEWQKEAELVGHQFAEVEWKVSPEVRG